MNYKYTKCNTNIWDKNISKGERNISKPCVNKCYSLNFKYLSKNTKDIGESKDRTNSLNCIKRIVWFFHLLF